MHSGSKAQAQVAEGRDAMRRSPLPLNGVVLVPRVLTLWDGIQPVIRYLTIRDLDWIGEDPESSRTKFEDAVDVGCTRAVPFRDVCVYTELQTGR